MGGLGSGSLKRSWRMSTADVLRIDIRDVAATGALLSPHSVGKAFRRGEIALEMIACESGTAIRMWRGYRLGHDVLHDALAGRIFVRLATTAPRFGGRRFWFVCPRPECQRRCRILYRERDTNARAFACRKCLNLVYDSQRLSRAARLAVRAEVLAQRLVCDEDGRVTKPKWMRWRTFDALVRDLSQRDRAADAAAAPMISRLEQKILDVAGPNLRSQFAAILEQMKAGSNAHSS